VSVGQLGHHADYDIDVIRAWNWSDIESTHAQAIRRSGLRRTRYRGLPKTHLQHVVTAAAINLLRIAAWSSGVPITETRCSRFAALQLESF
jgi:hypothetical protein